MPAIAIPIEVIASGAYLSAAHQKHLFGYASDMEILRPEGGRKGQFVYKERVFVVGGGKSVSVPVHGPAWEVSHVELTPADAKATGIAVKLQSVDDLRFAADGILQGPSGVVELKEGVIIPTSSLYCSPDEAKHLGVAHGNTVKMCLSDRPQTVFSDITVRVHPTYTLLLRLSPGDKQAGSVLPNATAQLMFS